MQANIFTATAAQRILNARRIKSVKVLPHVVSVVFQLPGVAGYCSRFVSKKAFAADAATYREEGAANVTPIASNGRYVTVEGSKGDLYTVDLQAQTCTCPDHTYRRVTCKHMIRAMATIAGDLEGAIAA
jgi:hypothetical protein